MRTISTKRNYKLHIKSIQEGKILDDLVVNCKVIDVLYSTEAIRIKVHAENGMECELFHIKRGKTDWLKKKFFSHIVKCGGSNLVQYCIY